LLQRSRSKPTANGEARTSHDAFGAIMSLHRFLFTLALTCTSRAVQLRDLLLGRIPRGQPSADAAISRLQQTIPSGRNLLDAVFVQPAGGTTRRSVLICHGIGEVVSQWYPIQRLFAAGGIASLVFDYSGYGRSTGRIDWSQCEQDAIASFARLEELSPAGPISVFGFSLGTGVASAVLHLVAADCLVLCAGFTSFRDAAHSARIPKMFSALVPSIWSASEALCNCSMPVLVVQGDRDRLFSMQMGQNLCAQCGPQAELLVLPARSHNAPFYRPQMQYWGPIISWMLAVEHQSTNIPSQK
jgi:pimeloyl-ACP methyl ester carboxylesterase